MMIDAYCGKAKHCGRLSIEGKRIRRLKRRRKARITEKEFGDAF
jgi:hypothetical protein